MTNMMYDWSRCQIDPFILVVLNWCRCQIFLQSLSLPAGVRLTRHQNHVSPIFPPPPPFPSPPPTSWSSCSSCPSHCWRGRSGSTFTSLCRLTSGAILPTTLILVLLSCYNWKSLQLQHRMSQEPWTILYSFIGPIIYIIYSGNIGETSCSDMKIVQICQIDS